MKKFFKAVFIILIIALVLAAGAAAWGIYYLTDHEYKPENIEKIDCYGMATKSVNPGNTVTLLTYNIAYGACDESYDLLFEGGTKVFAESSDKVISNLNGITDTITAAKADVVLLQEVDLDSNRTFNIDEASIITTKYSDSSIGFAYNHCCEYIPYPIDNRLGKVNSGMLIVNKFNVDKAERVSLSNSYTEPAAACQPKSCFIVQRVPVLNSTKELVVINVQLDKYDSVEARENQYKEITEFMQLEFAKGSYVIAGGCFNGIFPSAAKDKYPVSNTDHFEPFNISTANLTGGWKYCTDDKIPTARLLNEPYDPKSKNAQFYVMDGFICSPNTLLEETKTIDTGFKYSSHNPVVTTIQLVDLG